MDFAAFKAHLSTLSAHRKKMLAAGILLCIVLLLIIMRIYAMIRLRDETDHAVLTVETLTTEQSKAIDELVLPGTVQAWHEATIYAQTSGYVRNWYVDIGSLVKQGDLLAELDTPEVDAQLHQAQADLNTAQANYALAAVSAERWSILVKKGAVSQQDADEKILDAAAKKALVASTKANVDRLLALENFKHVLAPYAGVITARNTDRGALINSGNGGAGMELFRIAEINKMRVYVQAPQLYAMSIKPDLTATLYFAEHPNKTFPVTLLDTAHALNPSVRTLLLQFILQNAQNEIMPGGYTEVHMKIPQPVKSVRLPVNTLIFRANGMEVATVDNTNHARIKPVKIGLDFGNAVEIVAGITPGEQIIVNPPDSLVDGEKVKIAVKDPNIAK